MFPTVSGRFIYRLSAVFLLAGLCLAGCAAPESGVIYTSASPAWRDGLVIGRAYRTDSPAIGISQRGWLAAWASGDSLYIRRVEPDGTPGAAQRVLRGRSPWRPALIPGPEESWHLLWFDQDNYGDNQIYSATLEPGGALLRGPVAVTADGVSSAAMAPADGGAVAIIWASRGAAPRLYGQRLDSAGRPAGGAPVLIAAHGEYPSLNRLSSGVWVLAWLAPPEQAGMGPGGYDALVRLAQAPFPWEGEARPISIGHLTLTGPGWYLESAALGLDRDTGYLFLSQRDASDGSVKTKALLFPLSGHASPPPSIEAVRLPASSTGDASPGQTGFNTGPILASQDGDPVNAAWPMPVYGQHEILPVAFSVEGWVMVGYFQGGQLAGYQAISRRSDVLGSVGLWTDRDRYLTVSWANAPQQPGAAAELVLSTTQPASIR